MFLTLHASCCIAQLLLLLCQPYKTLIFSKLLPTGNPHFKTITTKSALLISIVFLSSLIQKEQRGPDKRTNNCLHRTSANNMTFYVFGLIFFMYLVTIARKLASLTISMIPKQAAIMKSNYKSIILCCDGTITFSDLDSYPQWVEHAHKDTITHNAEWSWFRSCFDHMRQFTDSLAFFEWITDRVNICHILSWIVLVHSFKYYKS